MQRAHMHALMHAREACLLLRMAVVLSYSLISAGNNGHRSDRQAYMNAMVKVREGELVISSARLVCGHRLAQQL